MTLSEVSLADLIAAREALVTAIVGGMPSPHRRFLVGFKKGQPDWSLLDLPGAADLPAVRWKQQNLDLLTGEVRARLVGELEALLA
jgi:hypothetical protein